MLAAKHGTLRLMGSSRSTAVPSVKTALWAQRASALVLFPMTLSRGKTKWGLRGFPRAAAVLQELEEGETPRAGRCSLRPPEIACARQSSGEAPR